jgi:hypothetical protein
MHNTGRGVLTEGNSPESRPFVRGRKCITSYDYGGLLASVVSKEEVTSCGYDLYGQIARILQTMTHRELSEAPQQIAGLVVANGEGLSKRERIDLALANLTQAELARFALNRRASWKCRTR